MDIEASREMDVAIREVFVHQSGQSLSNRLKGFLIGKVMNRLHRDYDGDLVKRYDVQELSKRIDHELNPHYKIWLRVK